MRARAAAPEGLIPFAGRPPPIAAGPAARLGYQQAKSSVCTVSISLELPFQSSLAVPSKCCVIWGVLASRLPLLSASVKKCSMKSLRVCGQHPKPPLACSLWRWAATHVLGMLVLWESLSRTLYCLACDVILDAPGPNNHNWAEMAASTLDADISDKGPHGSS